MKNLNRQKVMVVVTGVVLLLFFGILAGIYEQRREAANEVDTVVKRLVGEKKQDAYAAEIEELDRLAASRFIKESDRIRAYSALATIYIWRVDYLNAVQYSVKAICSAEKINRHMSAAWSYLQLTDVFIQLGAYDMAEKLVQQALAYQVEPGEEERRIKELAYINMADLCAATNRSEESRRYLEMADAAENEEDFNHPHMMQAKQIIKAENFWNERNYSAAHEALVQLKDDPDGTDLHLLYVHIPLLELKSKLAFAEGDKYNGEIYSKKVLEFYASHNDSMKRIEYLTALVNLLQESEPALAQGYHESLVAVYPLAVREANSLTAQFLLSAHQESVSHYQEQENRSFLIAVVMACLVVLFFLLCMFRRIWRQSRLDALTGSYNRRYLNQVYGKYKKRNVRFGVIMLDVDYFKQVNDTWGHKVGDIVLRGLSMMCMENLPAGAMLFRFGGEEFCILYRTEVRENVIALAHRLRQKAEMMQWEEKELKVTISLGVAYAGEAEELLILADQNLYHSKMKGRNDVTHC